MDLLGSILSSMDAPPASKDKELQKKKKEAKLKAAKLQAAEKKERAEFRASIERKVTKFIQNVDEKPLKFPPMDKIERSVVHDVAELAGLISFAFGEEDVDRYIMLWKKEHAPTDAELDALRSGEEFDPNSQPASASNPSEVSSAAGPPNDVPVVSRKRAHDSKPEKYFEKYQKIVGKDSGVQAAKATTVNKAYGMVPSKNKTDQRSIEQTLKDIREKKKLKTAGNQS